MVDTIDISPVSLVRPVRQNIKLVPSDEVMGAGSWVKIRSMLVSEHNAYQAQIRASQKLAQNKDTTEADIERSERCLREMITSCVLAWNWVDGDGQDLPQPHKNPDVIEILTDDEVTFLMELILNSAAKKKTLSLK